ASGWAGYTHRARPPPAGSPATSTDAPSAPPATPAEADRNQAWPGWLGGWWWSPGERSNRSDRAAPAGRRGFGGWGFGTDAAQQLAGGGVLDAQRGPQLVTSHLPHSRGPMLSDQGTSPVQQLHRQRRRVGDGPGLIVPGRGDDLRRVGDDHRRHRMNHSG